MHMLLTPYSPSAAQKTCLTNHPARLEHYHRMVLSKCNMTTTLLQQYYQHVFSTLVVHRMQMQLQVNSVQQCSEFPQVNTGHSPAPPAPAVPSSSAGCDTAASGTA